MSKGNLYKTLSIFSFMPLPLPWFDNQIDPLLPTDIKPLLYLYDQYQTYDLIKWERIASFWQYSVILPFDFFSLASSGIVLIERFTPWSYAWCDDYSTKLYSFIEQYCGTDYYLSAIFSNPFFITSPYLSPIYIGREDEAVNIPKTNYLNSEILTFTIPITAEQEEIFVLTWLADNEENNSVRCFNKQYKLFYSSTTRSKQAEVNLKGFLLCSLVISSSNINLVDSIKSQLTSQGLLYEKLDLILLELENVIASSFPQMYKVVNDYTFTINKASLDYEQAKVFYDYGQQVDYHSMTLIDKPNYYKPACLLYANNNFWDNGEMHSDLGESPIYYGHKNSSTHINFYLLPLAYSYFTGWDCNGVLGLQPQQKSVVRSPNFFSAYCKFHYGSKQQALSTSEFMLSAGAEHQIKLSKEQAIERIDNFLYQSSVYGEFDNA